MSSRRIFELAGCALVWACLVANGASPVVAECTLFTIDTTAVAFGTYNPANRFDSDTYGELRVTCHAAAGDSSSYEVSLGAGNAGKYVLRELRMGSERLTYNLFTDPSRSLIWGDGSGGSMSLGDTITSDSGTGSISRQYPVYGRIFARQQVHSGYYSDAIVVTIEF